VWVIVFCDMKSGLLCTYRTLKTIVMLTMQYMNSMDGNFVEKGIISAIKTNTYISYSVLMI